MKKKKKLITIISIIIILLVAISVAGSRFLAKKPEKKNDRIEIVRRGPLVVKLSERGNLDSLVKVEVRSNVEGEIDKLYVDEGYDVVKGQQLLKIDEKQIREEYNQAMANFNAAQAELERAKENARLSMDKLASDILLAKNSLASARSSLESTKAQSAQQLSQAKISITNIENLIEQDQISLNRAKIALEQAETNEKSALVRMNNAKSELDRKKDLYNKKFVPLRDVENAQLEYTSSQGQYDTAVSNVKSQKENIQSLEKTIASRKITLQTEKDDLKTLMDSIKEQEKQANIQIQQATERLAILEKSKESEKQIADLALKSAEANKIRAQSSLNTAQQRLGWTTVVAPITGRIVQCKVEEGEIITSGRTAWSQGPPIMTIADLSKMIVKTQVHEFDISKVKVGQKAEIRVSSYADDAFEGVVKEISPSAQFVDNIIKFEVVITVTKSPKPLLPGMTADVDIIVGERDNVLQLPLEAINTKETIKIRVDIKNEIAKKIKGQKVDVVINRFPDKKFAGRVTNVLPPKLGFSTSEITITMDGSPQELQIGTNPSADIIQSDVIKIENVEARIDSEREYFVKIAKNVTEEDNSKKSIWSKLSRKNKEKQEEKAVQDEEKTIKVGDRTSSSIEILDGLKEGDKVRIVPIGGEMKKKGNNG
jgi:RND family efflux transporter MFP subunit